MHLRPPRSFPGVYSTYYSLLCWASLGHDIKIQQKKTRNRTTIIICEYTCQIPNRLPKGYLLTLRLVFKYGGFQQKIHLTQANALEMHLYHIDQQGVCALISVWAATINRYLLTLFRENSMTRTDWMGSTTSRSSNVGALRLDRINQYHERLAARRYWSHPQVWRRPLSGDSLNHTWRQKHISSLHCEIQHLSWLYLSF